MFAIGIRFVWRFLLPQEQEVLEGALEDAGLAGFVAMEQGQLGSGGEGGEGVGDAFDGVAHAGGDGSILQEAGLDGPGAALPPAGDGHFLDDAQLDIAGGVELYDEGIEELLELIRVLIGEDDGSGEHAMTDGVLSGTLFACDRDGSLGAGSVGPRCFDSTL
jgi:hypothetical protein